NPLFKFKKSHIESRRRALEAYLNRLVQHHDVCQSFALRSFLSLLPPLRFEKESEACLSAQLRGSTDSDTSATIPTAPGSGELDERETHGMWMSKLSKTIGSDLNDLAGGDDSILDVITQQLGNQAVQQPAATPSSANRDEIRSDTASTLSTFRLAAPAEPTSATYASLTDPLCDLFIEVFELRDRNNWLRRQAINVLLRHIFGGAMERRVKDLIRSLVGESQLVGYITDIINTFWPHQRPFSAPMPRTPAQRKHTSSQVRQKLLFYLPYTLSSMVGRRNTEKGAERLFRITQHHLLNLHLALSIFDELIAELFPEIRRVQSSISAAATGNNLLYISPIQSPLLNPSIGSGGGRDPPTPIHRNRLNTL
ncbi:tRNA (guanine-N(7)-)-methyltransferase (tRNA(m7G46)-methyltransferase), partial [Spiromyces aspiralis]